MSKNSKQNTVVRFIRDIRQYLDYTIYSTAASLKADTADSRLGVIWFVLEPLIGMFVYVYIFSFFFHKSLQYVGAYIFLGVSLWRFFQSTLLTSVSIVKKNKGIISKTYLPKFTLILSEMLENLFRLGISLLISVFLLLYYKVPFSWTMFLVFPILAAWCPVIFGLSCLFLHFGVFISDLGKLLRPLLRAVFYISGVFYSLQKILGEELGAKYVKYNPAAAFMENIRSVFLYGKNCDWNTILIWFAVGIILSVIGVSVIYKKENEYVKVI